jgi:hypothetical protein
MVRNPAKSILQVDADRLALPGLRIDAHLESYHLSDSDLIALDQRGDVKENVVSAVIGLDEAVALSSLNSLILPCSIPSSQLQWL